MWAMGRAPNMALALGAVATRARRRIAAAGVDLLRRHPNARTGVEVVRDVARGCRDDEVSGLAAEVAFFALLSIFPGLVALAAALGFLEAFVGGDVVAEAKARVVGMLQTFLTNQASGTIEAVEELFREGRAGVLTFGFVGALWAASRGTAAVLRALRRVYDVAETRSRLRTRLLGLALAVGSLVVIALMLAMLVLGPLLGLGRAVATMVGLDDAYSTAWGWLALPVLFLVLVAWAAVMLHLPSHRHTSWKVEAVGAAVTGILWLALSLALRLYLELFGGNPVFGILGGVLVVLVWVYLLSWALLVGGEVNAVLQGRGPSASSGTPRSEPGTGEVDRGRDALVGIELGNGGYV